MGKNITNLDKLIELGIKKINNEIKTPWNDIGVLFGMSGEDARQYVKVHRMKTGILKGKYEKGRERILIMSDMHVPDQDEERILEAIEEHKNVNMLILAGDILDCKAVSSFYDEQISILDKELLDGYWLLKKMREITKAKIVLVKGNHEHRVNRNYAANAKSLGTALVETEILYKLANGFDIKFGETGERIHYEPIEDVFYCGARSFVHGDLLVNHPSTFSKIPMRTITNMYEGKFKYKYPKAKVIVIGHTHQAGIVHRDDGTVLIEDGCTCFNMSYAEQDDRPMGATQFGYVYLEMKDKIVDRSTIKLTCLGPTRNKYNIPKLVIDNEDENYIENDVEIKDKDLLN